MIAYCFVTKVILTNSEYTFKGFIPGASSTKQWATFPVCFHLLVFCELRTFTNLRLFTYALLKVCKSGMKSGKWGGTLIFKNSGIGEPLHWTILLTYSFFGEESFGALVISLGASWCLFKIRSQWAWGFHRNFRICIFCFSGLYEVVQCINFICVSKIIQLKQYYSTTCDYVILKVLLFKSFTPCVLLLVS